MLLFNLHAQINGVVTVVDSYHIHKHFEKGLEAKEQIAFADVVLVNKLDLIEESEKKISSMNFKE
ncbi:GTP-binding protein [Bacillus pacificus]